MMGTRPITLGFAKNPALLPAVRLTVGGVGRHAGLSLPVVEDLKVIAAEACRYCMQRGTREDGRLRLALVPQVDSFVIEVSDPAFKPAPFKQGVDGWPEDRIDDELFIIRRLAEELEYRLNPEIGLLLRISKSTR
jgi:anti-sigma regulatory factor (Ser/Thr protein kinase)